jgi:preprotein translocase subunit SecG
MTGIVMFLHAVVSILLAIIILMQSGRGGGLTEGFASAESLFGAKTNAFLIKATTIIASIFLVTCLSLAVLSAKKDKSLMSERVAIPMPEQPSQPNDIPVKEATPTASMDVTFTDTVEEEATSTAKTVETPIATTDEKQPLIP